MDSNVGPNAFRTSLLHFGWRWPICGCSVFPSLPPSTKPFVCFSFPLSPLFLVCCEILLFFGGRGNEKYCAVHFPFFNRTCFFSPTVVKKIFDFRRGGGKCWQLCCVQLFCRAGWAGPWSGMCWAEKGRTLVGQLLKNWPGAFEKKCHEGNVQLAG